MASILILGGGFAGLVAAERLAASVDATHHVTLVAPKRQFTFYPALVRVAFGDTEVEDITSDLGARLHDIGVRFVQAEVVRINADRRKVEVAGEDFRGEIGYDYLVLAMGRRLATEKVPGFFEYSHHLLGVGAAARFGEAVRRFNGGRIVVGMCPDARLPVPVCETAFALAKRFEDEIRDRAAHISVIFPGSLEEAFAGARLHQELEAAFNRHKINVLYDIPINRITADRIFSSRKHDIFYDLLVLVPPFRGHPVLHSVGPTDSDDFIEVDDSMRVKGAEKTYAAGDIIAYEGPKLAHIAVRQAEVVADNIVAEISGERPGRRYFHEIATVIDAEGPESIYLHYGIHDETTYKLKQGRFWGLAKEAHDAVWRAKHL